MQDEANTPERDRLDAVARYGILDTRPDGAFDRITALAARFFDVPISTITLVDEDRIWFKSSHGLDVTQIERAPGLCASVICSDEAYIVQNALEDLRTLQNPLVRGELGLRFYAAAPLVTHDGFRLGAINIIDLKPRELTDEDARQLHAFAGLVMDQMELRLSARKVMESLATAYQNADDPRQFVTVCAWSHRIRFDDQWMSLEDFLQLRLGVTVSHGMHPDVREEMRPK